MLKNLIFLSTLCLFSSTQASVMEHWDVTSDPLLMGRDFTYQFAKLPLQGSAQTGQRFWSGSYWADSNGSINYRWNSAKGLDLNSPTRAQAMKMSARDLATLSPTEKYDLFIGRYDYPLKREVEKVADYNAAVWEGICHGWSAAAINHNEPLPKTMLNPHGIAIPFGSSDIKALLSYYYAFGFQVADTHQMGRRCERGRMWNSSRDCQEDLNAGALHIALANKIGIFKQGFVGDMNRYIEVWNHPIMSYRSKIIADNLPPQPGHSLGTVKEIKVETIITYINEAGDTWAPLRNTSRQRQKTKFLAYYLEIDRWGNIVGGNWTSKDRIDFIWLKEPPQQFSGTLSRLGELLN